jgi:hypothetical protein
LSGSPHTRRPSSQAGSRACTRIAIRLFLFGLETSITADNGNDPSGPDGFTGERAALLALPFSIDDLTYVDDLLASAIPDEWAAIQEDADPAP